MVAFTPKRSRSYSLPALSWPTAFADSPLPCPS
jgi:hypothetical protein